MFCKAMRHLLYHAPNLFSHVRGLFYLKHNQAILASSREAGQIATVGISDYVRACNQVLASANLGFVEKAGFCAYM